jgi:hypothetical protein
MTLSGLLLGASDGRPHWFETGKGMIAIDTLVHDFLHRTGILDDCGAPHGYGVGCPSGPVVPIPFLFRLFFRCKTGTASYT